MGARAVGIYATGVADVAAAVGFRIGVQQLFVVAGGGYADPVIVPDNRCEIRQTNHKIARSVAPNPAQHAALAVFPVDPFETFGTEVNFVEGRDLAVDSVQVAYQRLDALDQ